jgi:hypothetical protein
MNNFHHHVKVAKLFFLRETRRPLTSPKTANWESIAEEQLKEIEEDIGWTRKEEDR